MADRYTVIYGNQIKDATVTENELASSVAGNGLSGGAGNPLAIDLNELTAEVVDVSADEIAIVDATDGSTKKESIADLVTAIAGSGLTATNGVLSADGIADDSILEVKLDVTNTPTDGYFLTYDQATGGFTWVESPATSGVQEADLAFDDFTASLNGVLTDFELTSIPVTASLQVFINGILAIEGSGKDYQLNPDSGQTKTIRIAGDALATGERLVAHYVINN